MGECLGQGVSHGLLGGIIIKLPLEIDKGIHRHDRAEAIASISMPQGKLAGYHGGILTDDILILTVIPPTNSNRTKLFSCPLYLVHGVYGSEAAALVNQLGIIWIGFTNFIPDSGIRSLVWLGHASSFFLSFAVTLSAFNWLQNLDTLHQLSHLTWVSGLITELYPERKALLLEIPGDGVRLFVWA